MARRSRLQGALTASVQRWAFARSSIFCGLSSRVVSICCCTAPSRCCFLEGSASKLSLDLGPLRLPVARAPMLSQTFAFTLFLTAILIVHC